MITEPLLEILRKSDNRHNVFLETFMNEYNYYNLSEDISDDHLKEFLLKKGLIIKVADNGIEPYSVVDGPGLRYTLFTQGCDHNCLGCHNPQTHDYDNSGTILGVCDIFEDIKSQKYLSGVTISGGDPLYSKNYLGVVNLCKLIKNNLGLNIWLYTGYDWDYVKHLNIVKYLDVVVDGRFILNLNSFNLKFKGSSNQRIIDVKKSLLENEVIEWHT